MTLPTEGCEGQWEKKGRTWYGWSICPDCGVGRWVAESSIRKPMFTGRCAACHRRVIGRGHNRYFPGSPYAPR